MVEGADELVLQVRLFLGEDTDAAVSRLGAECAEVCVDVASALAEHAALQSELFKRVRQCVGYCLPGRHWEKSPSRRQLQRARIRNRARDTGRSH